MTQSQSKKTDSADDWNDFISSFNPLQTAATTHPNTSPLKLTPGDALETKKQPNKGHISNTNTGKDGRLKFDDISPAVATTESQLVEDDFGEFASAITFEMEPVVEMPKRNASMTVASDLASPLPEDWLGNPVLNMDTTSSVSSYAISNSSSSSVGTAEKFASRPSKQEIAQMAAELNLSRARTSISSRPSLVNNMDSSVFVDPKPPVSVQLSPTSHSLIDDRPFSVTPEFFQKRGSEHEERNDNKETPNGYVKNEKITVNESILDTLENDDRVINEPVPNEILIDPRKFASFAFPSEVVLLADLNDEKVASVGKEAILLDKKEDSKSDVPDQEHLRSLSKSFIEMEMFELAALIHQHMVSESEKYVKSRQLAEIQSNRVHFREIGKLEKRIEELQWWILDAQTITQLEMELNAYVKHATNEELIEDESLSHSSSSSLSKSLTISRMQTYLEQHADADVVESFKNEFLQYDMKQIAKGTIDRAVEILYAARRFFMSYYYPITFASHFHIWRLAVMHGVQALQEAFYFILRMKATLAGKWNEQRRVLEQSQMKDYIEGAKEIHAVLSRIYTAFKYTIRQVDEGRDTLPNHWSESMERYLLIRELTLLFEKAKPLLKKLSIHLNDLIQMVFPDDLQVFSSFSMESEEIEKHPERHRCNLCLLKYGYRQIKQQHIEQLKHRFKEKIESNELHNSRYGASPQQDLAFKISKMQQTEDKDYGARNSSRKESMAADVREEWTGVRERDSQESPSLMEEVYHEDQGAIQDMHYYAIYHTACLQLWKHKIKMNTIHDYPKIGIMMDKFAFEWKKKHMKRMEAQESLVILSEDEEDGEDYHEKSAEDMKKIFSPLAD